MQEAEMGTTSMAMGGNNGRYQGDDRLLVRFYMHPAKDVAATIEAGRPIFKEVPYIHIMQPGNKESIIHRKATQMDKDRFVEHYRKFTAREDQDAIEGTPLAEWPGITRSQCEELKFYNVLSVEQLAGMSDTNAQNFRGINSLRQQAIAYLEAASDNASAQALAEQKAINARLMERLEALEGAQEDDGED